MNNSLIEQKGQKMVVVPIQQTISHNRRAYSYPICKNDIMRHVIYLCQRGILIVPYLTKYKIVDGIDEKYF